MPDCLTNPVHSTSLVRQAYRPDIDGLRAIAVLLVVGFHAFPIQFRGGFLGVDIFFVISGFLITNIIIRHLEDNNFSFVEFYSRRIRRIFPALFLVLTASFVFGWFVLLSDEYEQLGKQIAGGAGFVANFIFWNESGYFNKASETKPLLHLWSLGIEEQFYIVWPMLLWLIWKTRINPLVIIVGIGLGSFSLNLINAPHDSNATFYSPQTRFWELLIGAALAYLTPYKQQALNAFITRKSANLRALVGTTLISIAVSGVDKDHPFLAWWAVLATIGAALIISAGSGAWINRRILSSRILVWLGLISFPLYIWHWPLLSFARILTSGPPSAELRLFIILTSITLAWLTYKFVELPIRFSMPSRTHRNTKALIAAMFLIGYAGLICLMQSGFEGTNSELRKREEFYSHFKNNPPEWRYFQTMMLLEKYRDECSFYDVEQHLNLKETKVPRKEIARSCFERDPRYSHAVFIWGDSHAQELYFGLKNSLPRNWQILQVASSRCAPHIRNATPSETDYCAKSNWFALKTIATSKPEVVIMAQSGRHNVEAFNQVVNKLNEFGVKKIIFAGAVPNWNEELPKLIARKLWLDTPKRTFLGIDQQVLANNKVVQDSFPRSDLLIFANIIDTLCNEEGCLTYLGEDKKTGITAWDKTHLTPLASNFVAKNLLVNLIIDNKTTNRSQ